MIILNRNLTRLILPSSRITLKHSIFSNKKWYRNITTTATSTSTATVVPNSSINEPTILHDESSLTDMLLRTRVPKGYIQPQPKPDDEIIISMSSGVDSSVTALMYAKKYKNVRGIFMANWSSDSIGTKQCTAERDWEDVQKICQQINIPCERVNFEKEYWENVFQPMIEMYKKGLTPNPDVGCNKYVKFGKMIEHLSKKFEYLNKHNGTNNGDVKKWWLVTGHYAKVLQNQKTKEYNLMRADYLPKDQSYYLCQIPENVLSRLLLPIGHYTKPEVREIAKTYKLATSEKPDSQGLCFVSQTGKFKDFLNEYIEPNPGNIVTKDGKIWGKHEGLWYGTIGQRSGISLPQGNPEYKGIWFISGKNFEKNELIISKKTDFLEFNKDTIISNDLIFVNSERFNNNINEIIENLPPVNELTIQFRSLQKPIKLTNLKYDSIKNELTVNLDGKYFGIAPGQNLVIYHNEKVICSSVIISMDNTQESTIPKRC